MDESFIQRFLDEVDDNLADPHSQKRLPPAVRLRNLHTVQTRIFERLLNTAGNESSIGRAEVSFTIEADRDRYPLPPGFRNFLGLELRQDGDPDDLRGRLRSIGPHDSGPGVEILDGQRGCLIRPRPDSDLAGEWTLIFRKGPIQLHYARAASITAYALLSGAPPTNGGELVRLPDYYAGSLIRVYQADSGAPQVRECIGNTVGDEGVTLHFQSPWDPLPTGQVWYEVCPDLPLAYDSLYAMDVALLNAARRNTSIRIRAGLRDERSELWNACRNYFLSNISDRAPSRARPPDDSEDDPYD